MSADLLNVELHPPAGRAGPSLSEGVARPVAPVDVLIVTYNEEANLPYALRSVREWAARVFVVDCGSTDRTPQIARELGATIVEHGWEGYAGQKNWALDHLPWESPWVLILDADEAVTPELKEEVIRVCSRRPEAVGEAGFYVNRCLVFMGKRIRYSGYFPSWNLRLFKRGAARYEDRPVHEHMLLRGKAGYLRGLLRHEDRRGLEHYIAKHNRYSSLEAEVLYFGGGGAGEEVEPRAFGNAVERRRFFKTRIYPKLPARWLWRFVWMYFFKLGFLDGAAGLRFCLLISSHELFTSLKLRELQDRARRDGAAAVRPTTAVQLSGHPFPPPAQTARESVGANDSIAQEGRPMESSESTTMPATMDQAALGKRRQHSPWTFREKVGRALWMAAQATLFRHSFHSWYGWRRLLLRTFGARIGQGVQVRPSARIEIPWNLEIGDYAAVGDGAILYSLGPIRIGRLAVVSQYAHLCAGTHDYTDPALPLLRPPIVIGDEAWIATDAYVGPGVTVGNRAIAGARSTVVNDVPPGQIVAGNPARFVKYRDGGTADVTGKYDRK